MFDMALLLRTFFDDGYAFNSLLPIDEARFMRCWKCYGGIQSDNMPDKSIHTQNDIKSFSQIYVHDLHKADPLSD